MSFGISRPSLSIGSTIISISPKGDDISSDNIFFIVIIARFNGDTNKVRILNCFKNILRDFV